ncbi:MAG: export ABC transporter ATP-binding protein [Ignavibacteriae bacterium]|nr:MAG: export ABC transporter ATP-binding protein [Ignavibacteriota bacterium]
MNSVQITNVTKIFNNGSTKNGELKALDNVSLNIPKGIIFGLLGPNGAGKSTLMNCIVDFIEPDNGNIKINNIGIEDTSYKKEIGYVPQEIALYEDLSAIKNLQIFSSFYKIPKKILKERINEILELVQLKERKNDLVKTFSGGMKRRLNIAVSILHNPDIILCDEPTVGVDPQSRNAIFEMLQKLNREGKTIIYTTHYMEEAANLCNKLAIIDNGKIIAEGNLNELINLLEKKDVLKISKSPLIDKLSTEFYRLGKVTEFDFYYEIMPESKTQTNGSILTELEKMKVPFHLIELSKASLEDVFLKLTGRSLRD